MFLDQLPSLADLACAGQEGQHVARLFRQCPAHRPGGFIRRFPRLTVQIAQFHGVRQSPGRDNRRAVQQRRDAPGVGIQGGRHHQQAEVVAQSPGGIEAEGQPQVRLQVALVELVEDHQPDFFQRGIALQAPGQYALGHHLDAGGARDVALEPDLETHGLADRLAEQVRHPLRRAARGDAPWFEHQDAASGKPGRVEQAQRSEGRLARSRRRRQDGIPCSQRVAQARQGVAHRVLRQDLVDGIAHGELAIMGHRPSGRTAGRRDARRPRVQCREFPRKENTCSRLCP